ncbi:MAG: 4-hydroxy-tetrahydrodipicolinate synthase [Pseudonocardiales bacterium]|jgi:4-hydroxy-tetrahydrodipicolinate synthase|nr:4-hydroxy-tetrahydrodipicolinate synthase [Pseudonocardiales bacterium]
MTGQGGFANFTGSLVSGVTPFQQNGDIDFGALDALIERQLTRGTSGIYLAGLTGEATTLTESEYFQLVKHVLDNKGPVPYLIGCSGGSERDVLQRVHFAAEHGAEAVLLTVPHNMGPSTSQATEFVLRVADASAVPIVLFNNPSRLLTDFDTESLIRIAHHDNVIMHKEGSSLTGRIPELLPHIRGQINFMGDDCADQDIITPSLAMGARGVVNVIGNIAPRATALLSRPWDEHFDPMEYRELLALVWPLARFCYSGRLPIAVKALMNEIGLPAGYMRRPLTELPGEQVKPGLDAYHRIVERFGEDC